MTLTFKVSGCLVFFAVNLFQGLFKEFGVSHMLKQYPPVHNLSSHCLVPYSEFLIKKQISLTTVELGLMLSIEIPS